ncbi:MAG: LLM class flavin-dependent oxidoreductase [Mycobacteriales bacterium]
MPLTAGLDRIAGWADTSGIDTLWIPDHLIQAAWGAQPDDPMLECGTALGYLAARTSRVRLGTMVSCVTYRAPAVLIKSATTLDVLSDGRAWLGLGAGYQEAEATAMGLFMPTVAERFDLLEDTLQLALQMWRGDRRAFHGHRSDLEQPICSPPAVTTPHPPILIGGSGERRTLPLVARYGGACNLFDIPDGGATLRAKLDVLTALCERIDRDPGTIEKTVSTRLDPAESTAALHQRFAAFRELGIDQAVILCDGPWTDDRLDQLDAAFV